jgi:hypothetical protein
VPAGQALQPEPGVELKTAVPWVHVLQHELGVALAQPTEAVEACALTPPAAADEALHATQTLTEPKS